MVLIQHHWRDLRNLRPGLEPGPQGCPKSGPPWRRAHARVRRLAGTGAEESSEPSTVPPRQRHWATCHGAGESPAPKPSGNAVTGPADSASPSAPTGVRDAMASWVSTHRRCAWSGPMSTAESGPPTATPNCSETVRDNRRQPATTSGENSFGRVSPCERPADERPSKSHHVRRERGRGDLRQPVQ